MSTATGVGRSCCSRMRTDARQGDPWLASAIGAGLGQDLIKSRFHGHNEDGR